jgi:death-on-curing protein
MTGIIWLKPEIVLCLHSEGLAEHSGPEGIRSKDGLHSALARPQDMVASDAYDDVATLAATYVWGLLKNHPFVDGNKRVAFTAAVTFLRLNSYDLTAALDDCVYIILVVASGKASEEQLIAWFQENTVPV